MKCLLISLTLLVFSCAAGEVQIKHLPERLKDLVCHKSDENFDECVKENFKRWIPHLLEGLPEFGIPPIDPFILESFKYERFINEELRVSGALTNIYVEGAGDTILEDYRSDHSSLASESKIRIPHLNASFDYDISGLFFGVPFSSQGNFDGSFVNIRLYVKMALKEIESDGIKFLMVDKMKRKLKLADGHIKLIAADPSSQAAVDAMAAYFNNNPTRAVEAMQRFEETYPDDSMVRNLINQELSLVPESEILPD